MKLVFVQVTIWRRLPTGRIWILPPLWKPPAPSPCEARAGRGQGRGARSIELWRSLEIALTLSPVLRRGERESPVILVVVSRRAQSIHSSSRNGTVTFAIT